MNRLGAAWVCPKIEVPPNMLGAAAGATEVPKAEAEDGLPNVVPVAPNAPPKLGATAH